MNRILLLVALSLFSVSSYAQCTPDPLYADSLYGVWPDTITNFAPATLNESYFQQLDIAVPSNTSQVPGLEFPFTLDIDSGRVTNVTGLPPGLSYACNSQTPAACTYIGGDLGCAFVEGEATELGVYEIEITVEAFVIGFPNEITFGGYRIEVTDSAVGLSDIELKPVLSQNIPNPFTSSTVIPYMLSNSEVVQIRVLDLLGQEVFSRKVEGQKGENSFTFIPESLEPGIYLYAITSSAGTITRRMVYDRP